MFVFGLPRTGTTLTINLLSADPGRRCLLRWEALNPAPPAKKGELQTDLRCGAERQKLAMMRQLAPHIAAAHRSEERREGNAWGRRCRSRWTRSLQKKKKYNPTT